MSANKIISIKINPEIAYLLGALRDATIDVREGKNYEIKIAQKETAWLRLLQKLFEKNFGVKGNITKHRDGYEILRMNGRNFVKTVIDLSEIKTPQDTWNTPKIIKSQSLEIKINYLRGFFDAEGGLPRDPKNAKQKYISFSQKNRESIEFLRNILIECNFKPTNITFCGKVWEFRLTRKKNLSDFCKNIGSWHGDKKVRLKILNDGITFP
jgi:intein-encoded DNA endonuclease-like protein